MADKVEQVVETGVDELLRLLKQHDKLPIQDVAKTLNIPLDVVQSWIDFLVEEKILGIEYKFTVPYVFMNMTPTQTQAASSEEPQAQASLLDFKHEFNDRAESTLPQGKGRLLVVNLWRQHLQAELDRKRPVFLVEAGKRNIPEPERLWATYVQRIHAQAEESKPARAAGVQK